MAPFRFYDTVDNLLYVLKFTHSQVFLTTVRGEN